MSKRISNLGFTLIELMVATSIIGILMAVSVSSFQNSRKSARDGKRKADLVEIKNALEIYRTDCGQYPTTARLVFGSSLTSSGAGGEICSAGIVYMQKVPQDPLYPTYQYGFNSLTNSYSLCAHLERSLESTGCPGACAATACGAGTTCNYVICNP